ncbi:ATP-binding mismatch repair protein [Coemansia spiralis]|uniref:ATP-binding mismatch repair protein n=1 Tax=Coemansia spiralis TaxID=417178 RepID=A0A9W8L6B3_9FUNG|nr:ATP-binding mismatch repair protein [Coemansia spiralis]
MAEGTGMRPIAKETIHKLCSGQVIVDLATSAKELLENSLDAGATSIDIKMRDSGLTSITVTDNGHGISPEDYETLCRKHWTSKITSFEDLDGVTTFGFRGEALSSLCAVASVTITTATRDSAPMGMSLEFDQNGELVGRTAVARERGTTVVVSGLFARWPVRLADLKKNSRREYTRLVGLVEQYSIICDGVRITLSNQTARGAPVVSVRTPPQSDRLTRLLGAFGAQLRPHLVHFEFKAENVSLEGHFSRPEGGRNGSDKQYFFVNGRPCDLPKAKKLVNELFRGYCPHKYPVFAIAVEVKGSVDVNLTPDKREVLIRCEESVLLGLKDALVRVLEPDMNAFSVSGVEAPAAGPVGAKRQSSQPCEDLVPPPPAVQKPRLSEQPDHDIIVLPQQVSLKKRAATVSKPPSTASKPPATTSKPSTITSKPPLAATNSAPKKMGTVVIGSCRNRIQNDTYDWKAIAARLRTKQVRQKSKLEDSQQRDFDPAPVMTEGGLSVTDPEEASSALSRLIHKTDFQRMQVLGQFNHGFIISLLDKDLYIIDQHASDEKYNFEQLQQRAQISSQPLIHPAVLELGVTDEAVAIECRDKLEKNGFFVDVDEDALPGQRLRLKSQPVIDKTVFDQRDLMELVAQLCVDPVGVPRCERARRVFASRACRKSTMIGDPLSRGQMRDIVAHLGELDHPWNCPHGRPTLRHLHRLEKVEL